MFDIRVFNALATQTSIKIGQISFNVTTPLWRGTRRPSPREPFGHGHLARKFPINVTVPAAAPCGAGKSGRNHPRTADLFKPSV